MISLVRCVVTSCGGSGPGARPAHSKPIRRIHCFAPGNSVVIMVSLTFPQVVDKEVVVEVIRAGVK